jgi:catecholate siderophore receptor
VFANPKSLKASVPSGVSARVPRGIRSSYLNSCARLTNFGGRTLAALLVLSVAAHAQDASKPLMLGTVKVDENAEANRNALRHAPPLSTMPAESLQDLPQAVNVVSGEIMKSQAITTLGDALRNVPGITIAIGEGGTLAGDQFKIRGFDAKDDVYLDGLRDFGAYTRDSFNYEEVQVMKGPSGLMFGRGTTGGAINTISKAPHLNSAYSAHIEGGNGDHVRGTADLNYQISDTVAVRMNFMYTSTGVVDRDEVYSHRWGIAPSIALGLGTDTVATLSYIHQHTKARQDYGLPAAVPSNSVYAFPVSEYGVPRNSFLGFAGDRDQNDVDLITLKLSHTANDWLTINNDARAAIYSRYFQYTATDRCDTTAATNFCANVVTGPNPTGALAGIGGGGPYQQDSWGVQDVFSVNANFHLGTLKTQLIAGMDVAYQKADRTIYAYTLPSASQFTYLLGDGTVRRQNIGVNLYNPIHSPPPGYNVVLPTPTNVAGTNASPTTVLYSSADSTDLAFFVTDRLWLTDQLSAIAGVRVDSYKVHFKSTTVAGVDSRLSSPSTIVNPRASLVYEPSTNTTMYFSYGKSAVPQGTSAVGSPTPITVANNALDPEKSETYEIGIKHSLFNGDLGLSASIFEVKKDNANLVDPVSGDITLQSGQKQRVRGAEFSVTGKITEGFNVLAAYTYLDPKITFDLSCGGTPTVCLPNRFTIGKQINFVPKHAASLWTDVSLGAFAPNLKGLSFGGGIVYQSKLYNSYQTTGTAPSPTGILRIVTIPETVELDAVVAYQYQRYRFAMNVNNITDRLNYSQSFGNRGTPSPGRTFVFSVDASF